MGAVSEVGEEPVQPMAERRVWWCGGWPHCEKAARMVGWAPAHAQAGFERAEGGLGEGKCCIALCMSGPASGQVAHQSRKNSSPKDRETCDCRASRTDSELMLLAPAPRLPFFLAWLPSGAVVVSKSARPGVKGKKGQGVRGSQGGISLGRCLSRVRALCVCVSCAVDRRSRSRRITRTGCLRPAGCAGVGSADKVFGSHQDEGDRKTGMQDGRNEK